MLKMIFKCVTADDEEAEDQNDRQEAEAKHDPFGERELPPTLIQPVRGARSFSSHGARYETESWRSNALSGWQTRENQFALRRNYADPRQSTTAPQYTLVHAIG